MDEAACLVRKMLVFGVGDFCKLLWGMGLRNFGFLCFSKIVQTGFMSFLGAENATTDFCGGFS